MAVISSMAASQPTDPKEKSGWLSLAAFKRADKQSLMTLVVPRLCTKNATGTPFMWRSITMMVVSRNCTTNVKLPIYQSASQCKILHETYS
jgi:hypothetical protein